MTAVSTSGANERRHLAIKPRFVVVFEIVCMAGDTIEKLPFQTQYDRGIFADGGGSVNFTRQKKGDLAGILNKAITLFKNRCGQVALIAPGILGLFDRSFVHAVNNVGSAVIVRACASRAAARA